MEIVSVRLDIMIMEPAKPLVLVVMTLFLIVWNVISIVPLIQQILIQPKLYVLNVNQHIF